MDSTFAAGQRWRYRAPAGFETSRIVIGAIISFEGHDPVICCMVTEAPQRGPDGEPCRVAIPFIPMARAAFEATIAGEDGTQSVSEAFRTSYEHWKADARGLSYFTVPFEGSLARMIAMQMAALVEA